MSNYNRPIESVLFAAAAAMNCSSFAFVTTPAQLLIFIDVTRVVSCVPAGDDATCLDVSGRHSQTSTNAARNLELKFKIKICHPSTFLNLLVKKTDNKF